MNGLKNSELKKYLSEFIGTFILVFCGTGAIIINEVSGGSVTHVGISLTFGLVVLALIYALGDVSGAHFNPAVTIGFFLAGRFEAKQILPYIISQLAGAVAASLVLKVLFPLNKNLGSTIPAGGYMQSFILEIILMFILMFVILRVAHGSKEKGMFAGIAIGSVIALEALLAGPVSGASMNPARSFGPAIISGNLESLYIYLTAPLIGAILSVFLWKILKSTE